MRRLVLLLLVAASPVRAAPSPETILGWMEEWDLARAEQAVRALEQAEPDAALPLFLRGNLLYLKGEYDKASATLAEASRREKSATVERLRQRVEATATLTRGFVTQSSAHFTIQLPRGVDEILAPYALEGLEAARAALLEDFGWAPPDKIRVEVYEEPAHLARVSTLTEKEIETSGTIALCKWNRLMIVSPRALVRGYPWLDTLNHEYTHYVVTRLSHDTVPIWLHEGIAKFEERRWRAPAGAGLPPSLEHLLAAALRKNKLIPFSAMHPSIAKLPSQEEASLAFAQVYTVVEYLWKSKGWVAVRRIIERMGQGATAERAIAEVAGASFADWERAWRKYLDRQRYRLRPGLTPPKLTFKRGDRRGNAPEDEDLPAGVVDKAKRYARLAGMLRARGRTAAAVLEYEKAAAEMKRKEPILQHKLARSYLELGRFEEARAAAQAGLAVYPEMPGLHIALGEVAMKQGDVKAAEGHLRAALAGNPFDPIVHCGLAELLQGQPEATREAQACRKLGGR